MRDQVGPDAASAVEMFSGNEVLREQVAGFAAAGIGIFHAGADYAALTPAERRGRGGSGSVTRVMLDGSRILLEPERVIAGFEPDATPAQRKAILDRHRVIELPSDGLPPGLVRLATSNEPALSVALELMEEDGVAFAEPDFIEHIGPRYVPTDPLFAQQWHPTRIGCAGAWDITRGEGIRIVVIDNGFDKSHQDLAFGDMSGWYRATPDLSDADFVPGTASLSVRPERA